MRLMKANSGFGGFEFMAPPGPAYYRDVPRRIPSLTQDQLEQLEVRALRTVAVCDCGYGLRTVWVMVVFCGKG